MLALLQCKQDPKPNRVAGFGRRWNKTPGQVSRVRTRFVEMELDHDSGAMRGVVLAGRQQGAQLDALDLSAIRSDHYESFSLPIEDRIQLEKALESLSELQRKVIYLFFYKDLCQTEIGRRLGLSQRQTSRTVASALKVLKDSEDMKASEDAGRWVLE